MTHWSKNLTPYPACDAAVSTGVTLERHKVDCPDCLKLIQQEKTFDTALLMIASVRAALKNNVIHFDLSGNLLKTEDAILEALNRDREITFDVTARIQVTTDQQELELLRQEMYDRT